MKESRSVFSTIIYNKKFNKKFYSLGHVWIDTYYTVVYVYTKSMMLNPTPPLSKYYDIRAGNYLTTGELE